MRLQREIKYSNDQIDRLVYEPYGLSDEEIGIVEEAGGGRSDPPSREAMDAPSLFELQGKPVAIGVCADTIAPSVGASRPRAGLCPYMS